MKKLSLLLISLFFFMQEAGACPGCTGSSPRDKNIFIIVGIFVVLTYIPMFILYKMIFKHRHLSKISAKV